MALLGALVLAGAVWLWLGSSVSRRMRGLDARTRPMRESTITQQHSKAQREHELSALAQAPVLADLLSAAVTAGASITEAIEVLVTVLDDPVRSQLEKVRVSLSLGGFPSVAWAELLDDEAFAPIASSVIRSAHTGAPIGVVLDAAATDLRRSHRAQVEVAARSAGVRSVAPLALCFLPAYLLVGVVPVVAGFARALFA